MLLGSHTFGILSILKGNDMGNDLGFMGDIGNDMDRAIYCDIVAFCGTDIAHGRILTTIL